MTAIINYIKDPENLSTIIQSISVVVALAIGSISTYSTWRIEKNKLASNVVLELVFAPMMILKTKNIGPTMATDIQIHWLKGRELIFPHGHESKIEPLHLSGRKFSLVPGQELLAYLGLTKEVYDKNRIENVYDFEISFSDKYSRKPRKGRFTFDMSSFTGVAILSSDAETVANALQEISKTLKSLRLKP